MTSRREPYSVRLPILQEHPITQEYRICTERIPGPDKHWQAFSFGDETHMQHGVTPLEAAMRILLHK